MGRCRKWQMKPAKTYKYTPVPLFKTHKINERVRKLGSWWASRRRLRVLSLTPDVFCESACCCTVGASISPGSPVDSKHSLLAPSQSCEKLVCQRTYFENARLHTEWKAVVEISEANLTEKLCHKGREKHQESILDSFSLVLCLHCYLVGHSL